MRHGNKINHLGRTTSHRHAMMANMASSLIINKRINTTLAKAKALRKYVEPLLTKSKEDSTHARRTVFSYLGSKDAVTVLFRDVATKISDRPGGYTRIIRTGFRLGDNAETCLIELVDYNDLYVKETKTKKAKTTRRAGGAKKKAEAAPATKAEKAAPVAEEQAPETNNEETSGETSAEEAAE